MKSKEIRPRDLVEVPPVPVTKENVAKQMSWTTAKFFVDVVESKHFSALRIVPDSYHWTKAGEDALNVQLRLELAPVISDLAGLPIVRQKAAAFDKEYGDQYQKNPALFVVCLENRDQFFDLAREQGRLQNPIVASLMDWRLLRNR